MNSSSSHARVISRMQAQSRLLAGGVALVSFMVAVGWLLNIEPLKSQMPGFVTMKFNSALAFTLIGFALATRRQQPRFAQGVSILIALFSVLTLAEYVLGWDLHIDQWLVRDLVTRPDQFPGRSSPITAVGLLLLGVSLLYLCRSHPTRAQMFALLAGSLSLLALVGYAYDTEGLYRIGTLSPTPPLSAAVEFALCISAFIAIPDRGICAFLSADSAGGYAARRLLPAALVVPIGVGWLLWRGELEGWYTASFGLAMFTVFSILISGTAVFVVIPRLHVMDSDRRNILDALRQANEQLETRVRDRTADLERSNRELVEERRLLHLLMDNIPDMIYFKDTKSRFIRINLAQARLLGVDNPDEALGKTDADFMSPSLAGSFLSEEAALFASGQPVLDREEFNPLPDGTPRWLSATKVPIKDEQGQVIGLVGISRDITAHKQAEQQALELREERDQVKLLSEFVQNTSHDFRTPLTIISTSLYLLSKTEDPEKRSAQLDKASHQIDRLTELIDRVQLMVWLDRQPELPFMAADINHLIDDMRQRQANNLAINKDRFSYVLHPGRLMTRAAPEELSLAVEELVKNAVQHSPPDSPILIRTLRREKQALIEICDSGEGIPPDDLPHVFERLYRADKARSIVTGGAGLGLSLTKRIVELHSGSLGVESTVGVGSTFRILLPLTE